MDHDFFHLFTRYWWLIFPVGWGFAAVFKSWMRHQRAQQALDVIKSYASQGKEIPPEVLRVLQQPEREGRSPAHRARGLIFVGFIFTALTLAFSVLIIGRVEGDDPEAFFGMMFVAVLMAGFAGAFFVTAYLWGQDSKRLDPP